MPLLHNLLTESAKRVPAKTAVIYKDEKISYGDLDMSTDLLASCLINNGVKAKERIGIYIDKSINSVTAVFGILKTGGSYVPLDPLAPFERHLLIINDCSLKYLVASSKKLPQIKQILKQENTLEHVVFIDINRDEFKGELAGPKILFKDDIMGSEITGPVVHASEEDLAYILYTSGSTGLPKGVMLSHNAAFAFIKWCHATFNINDNDIVSSHAPFHFDLSIFDIYTTIMAGASLCLVPQGLSSFPKSVVNFIESQKITTWYSVPSILTQMILHGGLEQSKLPALRQILFAGEVFTSKYLSRLMEILPDIKYYNLYGPTETNVITCHHVDKKPDISTSIPIGMLCDGVKSYILNDSGELAKDGGMGELYVSGPTLMNGYWNDPEKTDRVLFRGSFKHAPGEKVYNTGDLVSYNEKGALRYHGRVDNMIKSRGYRIELGEIETDLSAHPDVLEVAVLALPDEEIGKWIKAYAAIKEGSTVTENDLKHFCSKKLPHYMVPEVIIVTGHLPKTSTGKIDRKLLEKESLEEEGEV